MKYTSEKMQIKTSWQKKKKSKIHFSMTKIFGEKENKKKEK